MESIYTKIAQLNEEGWVDKTEACGQCGLLKSEREKLYKKLQCPKCLGNVIMAVYFHFHDPKNPSPTIKETMSPYINELGSIAISLHINMNCCE
jgi:ribosomal protein S27AE